MAEEASNTGDRANKRLLALLEGFNWEQKGVSDVDISCEKHSHDQDEHGIDGFATYEDPYLTKERGVIVESKSKQWRSWNSGEVDDDAGQVRRALECASRSPNFDQKLGFGEAGLAVNTAILGAWTNSEEEADMNDFDADTFDGYVQGCELKETGGGCDQVVILANDDLHRLASMQSMHESIRLTYLQGEDENGGELDGELAYFHPSLKRSNNPPQQKSALSVEQLFSSQVIAKMRRAITDPDSYDTEVTDITIVYNFEKVTEDSLKYINKSLLSSSAIDSETDEVWFYSYMKNTEEEDTIYEAITEEMKSNILSDKLEYRFKAIPRTDFKTYAENLIDEGQ